MLRALSLLPSPKGVSKGLPAVKMDVCQVASMSVLRRPVHIQKKHMKTAGNIKEATLRLQPQSVPATTKRPSRAWLQPAVWYVSFIGRSPEPESCCQASTLHHVPVSLNKTDPHICVRTPHSPPHGIPPMLCHPEAAFLVAVVTFGPMCRRRISKVSTVRGIRVFLIAILATVIAFGHLISCLNSKILTVMDQLGRHLA